MLPRAFQEPARGPASASEAYIKGPYDGIDWKTKQLKHKDANPNWEEIGEKAAQGQRNDVRPVSAMILSGERLRNLRADPENQNVMSIHQQWCNQLVMDRLYLKAWQNFETGKRPELYVRWGPGGVDKTRFIYDNYSKEQIYRVTLPHVKSAQIWFDGYEGEEVILFDEFVGNVPCHIMKELTDRYPYRGQVKGGFIYLCATTFFITSNLKSFVEWWPNTTDEEREAWERRLTAPPVFVE
jgi:hypothetical protein